MIKRLSDIYGKPFYHAFIEIYTISIRLDTAGERAHPEKPQTMFAVCANLLDAQVRKNGNAILRSV